MNMHSSPVHMLSGVSLRPQQRILVDELAKAYPNPVKTTDLVDVLHGHDPNGGPDRASYAVSKMMEHVRKRIEPVGWTIPPAIRGRGASGYRLAPIETIAKLRNGGKA
jgi:hypothetical protein